MPDWTPKQREAIETVDCSLLVSAAAGSGKTAVLSERCAHLICDCDVDVDQLLVVTFTEAAAAQMKLRISDALRERRRADSEDARLEQQIAMIARAQVSTLHSFCSRILRQNFQLVGIDPNFQMLDADEARLLRIESARRALAESYESEDPAAFERLVTLYADGIDENLIGHVLKIHELIGSVVDPLNWLDQAKSRLVEAAERPLKESELGRRLLGALGDRLAAHRQRCHDAARAISRMNVQPYADYATYLGSIVAQWIDAFEHGSVDALAKEVAAFDPKRKSPFFGDSPEKETSKTMLQDLKDQMTGGALAQACAFSEAEWREGLSRIVAPAGAFLRLVEDFEARYRAAKQRLGRLDFNDLERYALDILRDPKDLSAPSGVVNAFQRQFKHVLVDEYQDINEVQETILALVSRENSDAGNLFTVGDVKQSIYRFRLADPRRFLARMETFKRPNAAGAVIDLQANFRSRAPLLDSINAAFERLMTRDAAELDYDASQALKPGRKYPDHGVGGFTGAPVELHLLPESLDGDENGENGDAPPRNDDVDEMDRTEREAAFVAQRIHALMGRLDDPRRNVTGEGDTSRPIEYRDIVILLRSMKYKADQYANVLRQAGIPVFRDAGEGFFDATEIRDIRALLALLDNQKQDIPLAAFLRSPIANLANPDDCLARIRLAYGIETRISFHDAATRYAQERDDELAAQLRDLFTTLARWRDLARHKPLAELLWEIYAQSGYLTFVGGLENGQQRAANLLELHRRAQQFGTFSRQGLYRFLAFLDNLEDDANVSEPSVLSEAANVVRIMSIHHSKGLEYPVVFVPELGKKFNMQDTKGSILIEREIGLGISVVDEEHRVRYPSLASVLVSEKIRHAALAEEMRVLYVAMTRAKEHLILSGTCSARAIERWENLWQNHAGALPSGTALAANTMLDWVAPVAQMASEFYQTTHHSADEVRQWCDLDKLKRAKPPANLVRLEPLSPAPPMDDATRRIIERLTAKYAYDALSHVEAARSVTEWTKHGREAAVGYATAAQRTVRFEQTLANARCLMAIDEMTAADKGTATHLVLQHLNFGRACADLEAEIDRMVQDRRITASQAKAVDRAAIEWFIRTDLGQSLCAADADIRRELSFNFAIDPSEVSSAKLVDPADQVMVRGRIDLMLVEEDGLSVIDYKTDRVTADTLAERVAFYGPQVELYQRAMERITGRKVKCVCLVFLAVQEILRR